MWKGFTPENQNFDQRFQTILEFIDKLVRVSFVQNDYVKLKAKYTKLVEKLEGVYTNSIEEIQDLKVEFNRRSSQNEIG